MAQIMPLQRSVKITDEQIARTVRAIIAYKGIRQEDIPPLMGVSRGRFYSRMNGSSEWRADEVKWLADYLEVPLDYLYEGIPGLDECAARDSNPEPAGSGTILMFPTARRDAA